MVYGIVGNFGMVGDVESATCTFDEAVAGSNPSLSTVKNKTARPIQTS
jgi:hypothetical protein